MLTFVFTLVAALTLPPKPDRYVTDPANVLSAAQATALNERLANFERATSSQILVYVDNHLPEGTTIEELGSAAIKEWGVGQKGKDNGAILFVFVADRKMRIEVGYGLEGALTDAKSKRITSTIIKPAFQKGDYAAGIEQGADAMMAAVRGEGFEGTGQTVAESTQTSSPGDDALFFVILFGGIIQLITGYRMGRLEEWWENTGTFGRFLAALPVPLAIGYGALTNEWVVNALAVAIMLAVPWLAAYIIGRIMRSVPQQPRAFSSTAAESSSTSADTSSSSSWRSSSDRSDSFSSSSSSSSSFKGGGGSGGGGGASESW